MEHVPTLCAIGTVGIAAAGLALGRQDRNPPSRFASDKRYKTRNRSHAAAATAAPSRRNILPGTPSRTMQPLALDETVLGKTPIEEPVIDAPDALNTLPRRQQSTKGSLRGSVRARLRRQTNEDSVSRRSRDGSVSVNSSRPGTGQRPSSSWLQRISISSPRDGSSRSSSCPDSPSMSSSTAQMLPSSAPVTPAVEPNKLVKRSTSQRVLPSGNPTRPLGRSPTTSGLRRPATSHQRASTPSYHSEKYPDFANPPHYVPNIETSPPSPSFRDDTWHPYFTSYHRATTHKYQRRRANSISPNGEYVRQLTVEPGNLPTLLLATSITPEPREFPSDSTRRAPSTRRTYEKPDDPPPLQPPSKEYQNQKFPRYKTRGMTNNSASRNVPEAEPYRKSRGFSLTHGKARHISSHLQNPETSKTERIPPSSSGLRRRRNITDPTVFQRPMTSSQDEYYMAQASSIGQKTSPTLLTLPRPFDLGVDIPGDSAASHVTPLRDSRPSSFQRQRHPTQASDNSPPVSHPKPKRFSTAASDPASTLIGSDNDMKVFTSGDEDETDFQSDTAYDSFPSRAMRSSDSMPRGPRIETIFDQPAPQLTKSKLDALEQSTPTGPLSEGIYPNTSNSPGHDNTHGMTSTARGTEAPRPPGSSNTPTEGAIYKLPHNNTFTNEKSRQRPVAKKHISQLDCDIDSGKHSDRGSKHSLFDWSEQNKSEKDSQGSEYRPRTVHGKNEAEARATRTLTRRGPSVLHLRSQSVPVARDPNTTNESHPTAKFGTWGLGNKGVSEDWDGDFEFEESDELSTNLDSGGDAKLALPSQGMRVPQAIMERQASVHGQFGHVKELTMLVEELRRLRLQAKELHIIDGPSVDLWKEAEGIINLATLDDDESSFNLSKSPPSPTLNIDWCDEESPRSKKSKSQRNHDTGPDCSPLSIKTNGSRSTTPPDRARSSSTTKAQSVLDTIYQQRKVQDPVPLETKTPQQRLPFDTQSLRDLVVRAGVVTRALKDVVRRAQGVTTDSDNVIVPQDPPFSQIFAHPLGYPSIPHGSDLPNGKVESGRRGNAPPPVDNDSDVSARMKMMTVV